MANNSLGTDVLLEAGGFVFTPSGDIVLVTGIDNLIQALKGRIYTKIGELIFHPDYGSNLPDMVSRPNTDILRAAIYIELARICDNEPRVERINHLTVTKIREKTLEIQLDVAVVERNTEENILLRLEVEVGEQ